MSPRHVSTTVVEEVARSKGVHHTELPPLSDVIDPDALDALFAGPVSTNGNSPRPPVVEFIYADRQVIVHSSEEIEVHDHPSTSSGSSMV